jgi:hypothetical protein
MYFVGLHWLFAHVHTGEYRLKKALQVNGHQVFYKPFLNGLNANVFNSQTTNEDIFQSIKRNKLNLSDPLKFRQKFLPLSSVFFLS